MFVRCVKKTGAETPRFRKGTEAPPPRPWPGFVDLLRPCEVDGKVCRFHRFVEEDRLLLKVNSFHKPDLGDAVRRRAYEEGIIDPSCTTEVMRATRALIEWPDGALSTVAIERVTFLDRKEG